MTRRLAVIWVLVAALAPSAGIASTRVVDGFTFVEHYGELSEVLHSLGSTSAINVVIMGDGFTLTEQSEFDSAAADFIDEFFQFPPYSGRSCAFTIWKINLVSTDSGIDYYTGSANVLTDRNTPLDCSFGTSSQPVATITGDFALCRQAADAAELPSDCVICVIVNDNISHDGAMSYQTEMVTFMSSMYPWGVVMAHELGHLLVGLGDEYPCKICTLAALSNPADPDMNRTYPGSPPIVAPNLSTTYIRTSIPWGSEIAATTALPTVLLMPDNSEEVGAWEGGGTYRFGVYRPQRYCVMDAVMYQDENRDKFCKVCNETLAKELQFRCIFHFSPVDLGVLAVEPIRFPIPPCTFCPDSLQDYIKITMFAERYRSSLPPLPRIEVYDDWGKTVATSTDWHDGRAEVSFRANRVRSYLGALNFNALETGDLVLRSEIYVNGVKVEDPGR